MNTTSRLNSLDGLRGIAILSVIINHIPTGFIQKILPVVFQPFFEVFVAGGKTGVCILFLLTGFLMAKIYPQPVSSVSFWSRRYARLFPAFLVMVISLSLIKSNSFSPVFQILIILIISIFARLVWETLLKISSKMPLGKLLTLVFLAFQVIVALWYSLYLLRIPSPIYYQTWPASIQNLITAIVNATLTLPFGNYIGQLDGVYWSLITEVSFYLLYPILFVPIFYYINQQKSRLWKIFLLLSTLPFCWGIFHLSLRTPGFGMMMPYMFVYFIAGVAIGYNLPKLQSITQRFSNFHQKKVSLLFLFFIIFSGPLLYPQIQKFFQPWVALFVVFPLSYLVVVLANETSKWSQILSAKWLVFLGKYSYSLYLTHSISIAIIEKYFPSITFVSGFVLVLLSFSLSLALSVFLYHVVEKPYYSLPKIPTLPIKSPPSNIIAFFVVIVISGLYLGYRPSISLFTVVSPYQSNNVFSIFKGEKIISLTPEKPLRLTFLATQNQLGMITTHIRNNFDSGKIPSTLVISLYDSNNKLISQSTYNPSEVIENRFHSFGFPVQQNSKNHQYSIEYKLTPSTSNGNVFINATENVFNSVYFFSKAELLRHPPELFSWLISKLNEPFANPMFWFSLICLSPLLILLSVRRALFHHLFAKNLS